MAREICAYCADEYDDAADDADLCVCGAPVCSPVCMDNHLADECEGVMLLKEGDKVKIIDGPCRVGQTGIVTGKTDPTLLMLSSDPVVMEQKYEVQFAPGINLWFTPEEVAVLER